LIVTAIWIGVASGCGDTRSDAVQQAAGDGRALNIEPAAVNFGTVDVSGGGESEVEVQVSIRNVSPEERRIERIQKQCNCTTVGIDLPLSIGPGEAMKLPVRITLRGEKSGNFKQNLYLYTDEEKEKPYTVTLTGMMKAAERMTAVPAEVDFGHLGGWESPRRSIRLHHLAGNDMQVHRVSGDGSGLACHCDKVAKNGMLSCEIAVDSSLPDGRFERHIEFETNHGTTTVLVKGVRAAGSFVIEGPVVFRNESRKKLIHLRHNPEDKPSIKAAKCDVGEILLEGMESKVPGEIEVQIQMVEVAPGTFAKGTIHLESEVNGQAVSAEVPCFVDFRGPEQVGSSTAASDSSK
jgi:hypothetical protein